MNISGQSFAAGAGISASAASVAGKVLNSSPGTLGMHAVSTSPNSAPSDIAKAASIAYHIDIDGHPGLGARITRSLRKKRIKSKFAIDNDVDDDDPNVDEATREERAHNDTKMQRLMNVHIAEQARTRSMDKS